MRIIVFAAGTGRRLRNEIAAPKCLIEINGETLLARYVKIFHHLNLTDINLVVGYKQGMIKEYLNSLLKDWTDKGIRMIYNTNFTEGSILSLYEAREALFGDVLLIDGDMIFEPAMIEKIIVSRKKDFFLIDRISRYDDEAVRVGFNNQRAVDLARGLKGQYDVIGEWAGCLKLSAQGSKYLKTLVVKKVMNGERKAGYEFIIPLLFETLPISYELIDGLKWIEIDFPGDMELAKKLGIQPIRAH